MCLRDGCVEANSSEAAKNHNHNALLTAWITKLQTYFGLTHFKIKMSSFFKNNTMPTCQRKLETLFNETQYSALAGGKVPRRGRLCAFYLYSSATKRKILRNFLFTQPGSCAKRTTKTKEVAAFHAFGIRDASFSPRFQGNSSGKASVLAFCAELYCGRQYLAVFANS